MQQERVSSDHPADTADAVAVVVALAVVVVVAGVAGGGDDHSSHFLESGRRHYLGHCRGDTWYDTPHESIVRMWEASRGGWDD